METITLWIHIESQPKSVKFLVRRNSSELESTDLVDISSELCSRKEILGGVNPDCLDFFKYSDRITPLPSGTLISTLNTTDTNPLVVRYPLSDSQVVVRCYLSTTWFKKRIPHTSGLWYLIRHAAEMKFETLSSNNSQYFFVYNQDKKKSTEEEIEDEFALNKIVEKIQPPEDSDERAISLSIRIKGKKAYGDWEISEVLKKFLHQDGSSIGDVRKFKIDELENPDPKITEVELKLLTDELEKKKCVFKYVARNESTCREFISAFMTTAVKHVQSIKENLELKAEEWLDGSYGYGPTDYAVYVESIIALVAEVKKEDFEKGAAQNIVQMCSAVETLTRKRKIDEMVGNDVPVLMYGIVTNALQWYFIRWAGSSEDPTVEISGPHNCEFDSEDMEQAKKIAGYIVSILQQQVRGLIDDSERTRIRKRCRI